MFRDTRMPRCRRPSRTLLAAAAGAVLEWQVADTERAAALDADLDALATRFDVGDAGHLVLEWEYLLLTGRRA